MNKSEFIECYGQEAYDKDLVRRRELRKKTEYIKRHGEEAWQKKLEQSRAWHNAHPEQGREYSRARRKEHREAYIASSRKWQEDNPEKVRDHNHEISRKGGKRYERYLEYKRTGLQGKRNKIRNKHARKYRPYKQIIAPESQLHHEWIPKTAEYRGVALVEADTHMRGFIDVIQILDGGITLLTEEEVRNGGV